MPELTNGLPRWISCVARLSGAVALCAVTTVLRGADDAERSAARPAASSAESIDEQLMRDLDSELLDTVPSSHGKAADTQPTSGQDGSHGVSAGEDIGHAGQDDPLLHIAQEMRSAEKLIDRHGAVQRAENVQQQIVADLARLIRQLEAQTKQSTTQGQTAPQQQTSTREKTMPPDQAGHSATNLQAHNPAKDGAPRLGRDATQGSDLKAAQELMKSLWGQLPAHAREEMLQHSPEQFLPQYEVLIEKYYKRLAEQQRASP